MRVTKRDLLDIDVRKFQTTSHLLFEKRNAIGFFDESEKLLLLLDKSGKTVAEYTLPKVVSKILKRKHFATATMCDDSHLFVTFSDVFEQRSYLLRLEDGKARILKRYNDKLDVTCANENYVISYDSKIYYFDTEKRKMNKLLELNEKRIRKIELLMSLSDEWFPFRVKTFDITPDKDFIYDVKLKRTISLGNSATAIEVSAPLSEKVYAVYRFHFFTHTVHYSILKYESGTVEVHRMWSRRDTPDKSYPRRVTVVKDVAFLGVQHVVRLEEIDIGKQYLITLFPSVSKVAELESDCDDLYVYGEYKRLTNEPVFWLLERCIEDLTIAYYRVKVKRCCMFHSPNRVVL